MDVIFHSTYFKNEDALMLADAGYVGPQPRLFRFGNRALALFGAEDDVQHVLSISMGQDRVLQRRGTFYRSVPRLRRFWIIDSRSPNAYALG
jgi:hypothetical protein